MSKGYKNIFLPLLIVITLTIGFLFFQTAYAQSIELQSLGSTGLGTQSLVVTVAKIIQIFLGFLGVIALGLILYAGFIWMTSGGNQEKVAQAKKILINAVIGLIIVLSAFAITTFLIDVITKATGGGPAGPPECSDGLDNDGDTMIDMADPGCVSPNDNDEWNPGQPPPPSFNVQWTTPGSNTTNVSICSIIQAGFNKIIEPGTENLTLRECTNGSISGCSPSPASISGSLSIGVGGTILRFEPDSDLPMDSAFEVLIEGGLGGILGPNSMQLTNGNYIWYFATGNQNDNNPPQVSIEFPIDGQTNVCLNTVIQVEFNEAMDVSTLLDPDSFTLNGLNNINTQVNSPTTFIWNPGTLNQNTNYEAILNSFIIKDVCQNNLDGNKDGIYDPSLNPIPPPPNIDDYLWSFTTGQTPECIPEITSITQDGYYDGNYITISGSDFTNSYSSEGEVIFNNNLAVYNDNYCFDNGQAFPQYPEYSCLVSWSATDINIYIPAEQGNSNGAIIGPVKVEVPSQNSTLSSNSVDFTVLSPHLDDAYPGGGGEGQFVSLWGINFGAIEGEVWFTELGGTQAEADLPCGNVGWQDNNIIIAVPVGIALGDWQIQVKTDNGHWSNLGDFTVTSDPAGPGLCLLSPDNGYFEDFFNLEGEDFGIIQGQALFGNIEAPVNNWANDLINASVPNLAAGVAPVSVMDSGGLYSNSLPFIVSVTTPPDFYITYISPETGSEKQYITIYGSGFGTTMGVQKVYFGAIEGDFSFPVACGTNYWNNSQIIVKVPAGANGDVKVCRTSQQLDCTNSESFILTAGTPTPGICSINPESGPENQLVTIAGEPFDTVTIVELSNLSTIYNYLPPEEIEFTVPVGAMTGEVTVTGPGGTSNSVNFEVTGNQLTGQNFDYYEWQFETCQSCLVPQVDVLACYGGLYSSPSPFINSQDNFTDIDLAVKFNTEMDINSFSWGSSGTVILKECGSGSSPVSCSVSSIGLAQPLNLDQYYEWLNIDLANSLIMDTWYYIELTGDIRSLEGWQLNNSNGYDDWYFKTQSTGQECVADTVNVVPHPSYALMSAQITYDAFAVNSYSCNICNNTNYNWSWSSSDPSYAQIQSSTTNICIVDALQVTSQPVQIEAEADPIIPGSAVSGYSDLIITDGSQGAPCDDDPAPSCQPNNSLCASNFYCEPVSCICEPLSVVTNYGPSCTDACTNTSIFAEFNMEMNEITVEDPNNIFVRKCSDASCSSFSNIVGINVDYVYTSPISRANISPINYLEKGEWYRVVLMEDMQSYNGQNLSNLNYNYNFTSNNSFSWTFQVSSDYCDINSVSVIPNYKLFTDFGLTQGYTGYPYSNGNCQTPLNQTNFDWSWSKEVVNNVITVTQNASDPWLAAVTSDQEEGINYIRATAVEPISGNAATNIGNNGKVVVNLAGPEVLEMCTDDILSPTPQADRGDVCVNASVSARFNQEMESITFSNILVKDCGSSNPFNPANCLGSGIAGSFTNINSNASGNPIVGFIFTPQTDLNINTWYEVTIPITVTNITSVPMENDYKWHFKAKSSADLCEPQTVTVVPDYLVMPLPSSASYLAVAQTGVCDIILRDNYTWSWQAITPGIVTVAPSQTSQTSVTTFQVGETDIEAVITNITPQMSGFGEIIVTEPPEVDSKVPLDLSLNVCRNTEISATFNQLMNLATLNSSTIDIKKEVIIPVGQNPPDGCENGSGTGITFNNFIKKQFVLITGFFDRIIQKATLKLFNKEIHLFEKVFAQTVGDSYWCPVSGTFGYEEIGGQTKVYFNPFYILDASTGYKITIFGGSGGVKNPYGLEMAVDNVWEFATGPDICMLNFVKVYADYENEGDNTNSWFFTSNVNNTDDDDPGDPLLYNTIDDADKVYKAKAYSVSGQPLAQYTNIYEWDWINWQSDNSIVAIVNDPSGNEDYEQTVIAQNENGEAKIFVTAKVTVDPNFGTIDEERTGFAIAEVFICENPWYDPVQNLSLGSYGFEEGYFIDNTYNHKLTYCRDYGGEGTYDDLPLLSINPIYKNNFTQNPGEDNLLEEFTFWIYYLEAPSNLVALAQSMAQVGLNWTGVESTNPSDYFEIERATDALFIQDLTLITISDITATTHQDGNGLNSNTTYYYRIRAVYNNGYSSWSNITSVTTNASQST